MSCTALSSRRLFASFYTSDSRKKQNKPLMYFSRVLCRMRVHYLQKLIAAILRIKIIQESCYVKVLWFFILICTFLLLCFAEVLHFILFNFHFSLYQLKLSKTSKQRHLTKIRSFFHASQSMQKITLMSLMVLSKFGIYVFSMQTQFNYIYWLTFFCFMPHGSTASTADSLCHQEDRTSTDWEVESPDLILILELNIPIFVFPSL